MPLTTRLLVAALALATLSLNPLESFAGPLQAAIHNVPPDWLSRNGQWPRQTRIGMSCAGRILTGLGIGAATGFALVFATGGDGAAQASFGASLAFGTLGSAFGYKMCR